MCCWETCFYGFRAGGQTKKCEHIDGAAEKVFCKCGVVCMLSMELPAMVVSNDKLGSDTAHLNLGDIISCKRIPLQLKALRFQTMSFQKGVDKI